VGADESGRASLDDCQLLSNKQCGAMASGLNAEMALSQCVASKNGTHGIAAAGRSSITVVDSTVKNNKQLGFLIQSGAKADIKKTVVSKNGAHGICLQLGGIASMADCKSLKNKQTGVAVMGASSTATCMQLVSSDNGIDGCHVGQVLPRHLLADAPGAGSRLLLAGTRTQKRTQTHARARTHTHAHTHTHTHTSCRHGLAHCGRTEAMHLERAGCGTQSARMCHGKQSTDGSLGAGLRH